MSKLKKVYTFEEIVWTEFEIPKPESEINVVSLDGGKVAQMQHIIQARFFGKTWVYTGDSKEEAYRKAKAEFEAQDQDAIDPLQYKTVMHAFIKGRQEPVQIGGDIQEKSAATHLNKLLANGIQETMPSAVIIHPAHMVEKVSYYVSQF